MIVAVGGGAVGEGIAVGAGVVGAQAASQRLRINISRSEFERGGMNTRRIIANVVQNAYCVLGAFLQKSVCEPVPGLPHPAHQGLDEARVEGTHIAPSANKLPQRKTPSGQWHQSSSSLMLTFQICL